MVFERRTMLGFAKLKTESNLDLRTFSPLFYINTEETSQILSMIVSFENLFAIKGANP